MKKNNKGFTMIELLAVVVIISILMGIAVPAVHKYLTRARTTSEDMMLKAAYEAAENYMMNPKNKVRAPIDIKIKDLVDLQYLENLHDPYDDGKLCGYDDNEENSYVKVTREADTAGGLVNYKYVVNIECPSGIIKKDDEAARTFPKHNE